MDDGGDGGRRLSLFFYRNSYVNGFGIVRYEDGVFQIAGDRIKTLGEGDFAQQWGLSLRAFS